MIYFIPTIIVFFIQLYLLVSWWRSRQQKDGREGWLCFWGFLVGQVYFLWELFLAKQTGKPLPESPEQTMLMLRFALGASWGGLFVIIGLFYISFASYGQLKPVNQQDD